MLYYYYCTVKEESLPPARGYYIYYYFITLPLQQSAVIYLFQEVISMPALSFTAPHVTPEMEVAERDALSEEERKRIDEDLYGASSSATQVPPIPTEPSDDNMMITQSIIDELQRLPASETREYWDAQTKASRYVLEQESPPSLFLQHDKDQSPATIATRIALYWKIRCKLFGPSRAYLPMRIPTTEDEDASTAMSKEDKTLLETGFLAVHPKDEHGRTVLFMDRIKAVASPLATRDATVSLVCLIMSIQVYFRVKSRGILTTQQHTISTASLPLLYDSRLATGRTHDSSQWVHLRQEYQGMETFFWTLRLATIFSTTFLTCHFLGL